jgi:hypothetical protein
MGMYAKCKYVSTTNVMGQPRQAKDQSQLFLGLTMTNDAQFIIIVTKGKKALIDSGLLYKDFSTAQIEEKI